MRKIVLASNNEKKVKEFERLRDERRGIIETDIFFKG